MHLRDVTCYLIMTLYSTDPTAVYTPVYQLVDLFSKQMDSLIFRTIKNSEILFDNSEII